MKISNNPDVIVTFRLITNSIIFATTLDVIGVLKSVGDITSIITKVAQKQLSKLELSIVDQGLLQINLTLWGTQVSVVLMA